MHVSQSKVISPVLLHGSVKAPASKSVVQRVLAAGLLAHGTSTFSNYTPCDDALAAIDIVKDLGGKVCLEGDVLRVDGGIFASAHPSGTPIRLICGESGLSSRLFAPISLLFSTDVTLTGEGSLLKRPFGGMMKPVFDQLHIQYNDREGFLPLRLKGAVKGGVLRMDSSGGSQFLTGLLMTLPLLENDSEIQVEQLRSKPYIDLTIDIAAQFGIKIEEEDYRVFRIKGRQQYHACEYAIEGDWSGASCLLVAGAIAGQASIGNLRADSVQADKKIVEALRDCGAGLEEQDHTFTVTRDRLEAFRFDATDCPDLFPALVALAANCAGISVVKGVGRLATKESNRALTLQSEFRKLGITITLEQDDMLIEGKAIAGGQTVFAHNDHRIAMALATAALTAQFPVTIEGAECVNKSYPGFWDDLETLCR